jgi:hypothetical protein
VHDVETIASEDDELYQIVDNVESIMHVIEEWRPPKTETSSKKKK